MKPKYKGKNYVLCIFYAWIMQQVYRATAVRLRETLSLKRCFKKNNRS